MSFSLRTALVFPLLLLACVYQDDASTTSADVVESSACHEAWAKDAACTEMSVPLDWETPSSGSISYLVRRFPAKTKPRAQMWLVAGGPGEAGAPFALVLPRLRAAMPDVTFFVPDHRGTGRSTRLGCGRGDDMAPACLEELVRQHGVAGLQAFSTTNAAKDLEHAIGANRTSVPSYVYGVSYGTYLVNRYLQLSPEQADGIVLDGVCPAEGCADPDSNPPDVIGRRYLDLCGKDELCSSKLGTAPAATLLGLYRKLDGGHCAPFTTELVKPLLAQLLDRPEKRTAIAPLIYRLDRCTDDDHRALLRFASTLAPSPDERVAGEGASNPLLFSIARKEFFPAGLDLSELERSRVTDALFADLQTLSAAKQGAALPWPDAPLPASAHAWGTTTVPVLIVNGTLDAQTPDYRLDGARDHFRGAHQQVVLVPNAVHASLVYSACSFEIVTSFVRDPAKVDTSCVSREPALDFRGTAESAQRLFGTADLWEN